MLYIRKEVPSFPVNRFLYDPTALHRFHIFKEICQLVLCLSAKSPTVLDMSFFFIEVEALWYS